MNPFWTMVSYLQRPVIILLLTMSQALVQATLAQDYPSRPITLIVPLTAGGGPDTLARIWAERMKTTLGQPIVVENIPTLGNLHSWVAQRLDHGRAKFLADDQAGSTHAS